MLFQDDDTNDEQVDVATKEEHDPEALELIVTAQLVHDDTDIVPEFLLEYAERRNQEGMESGLRAHNLHSTTRILADLRQISIDRKESLHCTICCLRPRHSVRRQVEKGWPFTQVRVPGTWYHSYPRRYPGPPIQKLFFRGSRFRHPKVPFQCSTIGRYSC